jgi:hypothetical protein
VKHDATEAMILLQMTGLIELRGLPQVDRLVETALGALRGIDGLTVWEMDKLTRWGNRWVKVPGEVREFYRSAIVSSGQLPTGRDALWRGLQCWLDHNHRTEPWVRSVLAQLYREMYAVDPDVGLTPDWR